MRYLLDTHAYLWWTMADGRLSARARAALENPQIDIYLSVVSIWEIAIKVAIKRLKLRTSLSQVVIEEADENGFQTLDVKREHACRTAELPMLHRDPFDRMLVAQAQVEGLTIITRDAAIATYPVRVLW